MTMMVTENEKLAVAGIESFYGALQNSIERVNSALRFHYRMAAPKSKFRVLNFFKEMQSFSKEKKLHQLLSALTDLKAVFEVNMPLVIEDKLYFKFRGPAKGGNCTWQIGEAQSESDLTTYFIDLRARLSDTVAEPEISQAIASPLFARHCPMLARTNLRLSDSCQKYLMSNH